MSPRATMPEQGRPAPFRCAEGARERRDPQLGSAPQAARWLLIEHRGPWQTDAIAGSGIASEVLAQLNRDVVAHQARPLLVRRPGRTDSTAPRSWAVSYAEGVTQWGRWQTDDDLRPALDALTLSAPPESAQPAPLLLVCAHGVHDTCCAIRGRPVAATLAEEWPMATWECSHVGGDRFAANVVVLPDGVYYGNLDPVTAVDTVRAHLGGEVSVGNLRGMTRFPPPAQVAVGAVHERFGPLGARDVSMVTLEQTSAGIWQIGLSARAATARTIVVTVAAARRAPAQLTCRGGASTTSTQYRVLDLVLG